MRKDTSRAAGRLLGLALELPPVVYVVLTGTLPVWARTWMAGWLSAWLLVTIVQAVNAPAQRGDGHA